MAAFVLAPDANERKAGFRAGLLVTRSTARMTAALTLTRKASHTEVKFFDNLQFIWLFPLSTVN